MSYNVTGSVPYFTPPRTPGYGGFAGWISKRQRVGTKYGYSGVGTLMKKKRPRRAFRKSFKRKVLNVFGAKHLAGTSNVTITNAVIFTNNVTAQVTQGTSGSTREGDSIYLEAIKIHGHFQSATESNAYKFRLLIGYSGEEYPVVNFTAGNLTQDELFLPGTTGTMVNGIVNPKAFTVLYDQTIDLNSQIEGDRTIKSFADTISLKKQFPYQAQASIYGKTQNLYAVIVAYAPDLAVAVPIGSVLMAYDLIFKD